VRRGLCIVLLSLAGCGGQGAAVASALIVSGAASAISRASGGCYAACPVGTTCNEQSGLCETLPCRGICEDDQVCDESGPIAKCVPKRIDLEIRTEKEDTAPPETQPPE
jgi:hypothetical protein